MISKSLNTSSGCDHLRPPQLRPPRPWPQGRGGSSGHAWNLGNIHSPEKGRSPDLSEGCYWSPGTRTWQNSHRERAEKPTNSNNNKHRSNGTWSVNQDLVHEGQSQVLTTPRWGETSLSHCSYSQAGDRNTLRKMHSKTQPAKLPYCKIKNHESIQVGKNKLHLGAGGVGFSSITRNARRQWTNGCQNCYTLKLSFKYKGQKYSQPCKNLETITLVRFLNMMFTHKAQP